MGSFKSDPLSERNAPDLKEDAQRRDRPLYLLIFSSRIFHAHWSLFIRRRDSTISRKGKRAQVEGDPRGGFHLELVRGCNVDVDSPKPVHIIEIGRLRIEDVEDGPEVLEWTIDTQAVDVFEEICCAITPPAPSLKGNATGGNDEHGQKPRRIEIRDCQWWTSKVVEKLVEEGKLLPPTSGIYEGESPITAIQRAPKNA